MCAWLPKIISNSTILLIHLQHRLPEKKMDHCHPLSTFGFCQHIQVYCACQCFWSYALFACMASHRILHTFPTFTNKVNANYVFWYWRMQIVQCAWCALQYHKRCYRGKWMSNCAFGYSETPLVIFFVWITFFPMEPRHGWIAVSSRKNPNNTCVQPRPLAGA